MPVPQAYQDVLAAARKYMEALPADARATEASYAYQDLGREMRVGLHQQESRADVLIAERFYGQVKRALDTLAAEGVLVKIGKGDRGPRGFTESTPKYYTPAQYAHAVERAQRDRTEKAQTRARWEEIHEKLSARGIVPGSQPGEPVRLDLSGWGTLLGQLAKATHGW